MEIGYYKFKDGSPTTLRYGVSEEGEPAEIVEDLFDPDLDRWQNYAEVSRYVLFEYSQIEIITLDEAQQRTNGRAGDPADGVIPTKPPVFSGPYLD